MAELIETTHRAAPSRRPAPQLRQSAAPAVGAAAIVGVLALALGWKGGDLAAQVFRADAFQAHGLTLWNNNWYGGEATLGYSLISPALSSIIPPMVIGVVAGIVAAWAFDRIVRHVWGPDAWLGSVLFAVGTGANLAVGRIAFALGFAFALLAVVALLRPGRRQLVIAGALALAATLSSPVAGLFFGVAMAAWGLSDRRKFGVAFALGAVAVTPILLAALWFPAPGSFPYRGGTYLRDLCACAVVFAVVPRRLRTLRLGIVLYALVCLAAYLVATPLGANVSRLGQFTAAPIIACVLWPRHRLVLPVLVVPLLLWQWLPAYDGIVRGPQDPSADASYFAPVVTFLAAQPRAIGRIEVPPLRRHWESVHLGGDRALARGWERQLDVGYHPLFYDGTLDAATYRAWLIDNGVQFVALADADLEGRGVAEATLLRGGLPYLRPVLRTEHWQVWRVLSFQGLVRGPARVTDLATDRFTLAVVRPGRVMVRVRWSPRWRSSDGICPTETAGHWILLPHLGRGTYQFTQHLWPLRCSGTS